MENQINLYGYARVSTQHQNLERQIQALKEYGVKEENIFIDKKSGKDFNRDDYQLLKQILKRTQNNVLIIKSLDRLARSYSGIKSEWAELTQYADIVVLDMPLLDTTKNKQLLGTFVSDLILQILSYVGENERINIRQRQAEGIAIAKAKGKKFGRPKITIPENFEQEYKKMREAKQTARKTMQNLNLSKSTYYKLLRQYEKQNERLKKVS